MSRHSRMSTTFIKYAEEPISMQESTSKWVGVRIRSKQVLGALNEHHGALGKKIHLTPNNLHLSRRSQSLTSSILYCQFHFFKCHSLFLSVSPRQCRSFLRTMAMAVSKTLIGMLKLLIS